MTLTSLAFLAFFISVFFIYYVLLKENTKTQNWLLLLASYFFYGYSDLRMLPLLLGTTVIVYFLGIAITKTKSQKKSNLLSSAGVIAAIGMLLYFKYFNFFIESFSSFFEKLGLGSNESSFKVIMPLGISFFTFKLISYIIEIRKQKIEPSTDFVVFSTYISFFPTILSGPIDKPDVLIPQIEKKRSFDYAVIVDGCRQILYGLFLKMVIADNVAKAIDVVWLDVPSQTGIVLLFTAILYSFQLYTDFSGYSHIAIGIGKMLGFRITKNFNYPFFARNIADFWRSWHMSLTTWVTDYVFLPLNIKFRNLGKSGIIMAIIINMTVVGIWHGSKLTYLLFGLYMGLLYIPMVMNGSMFKKKKREFVKYGLPSLSDFLKMLMTFMLVTVGCVLFRAENLNEAALYFSGIFDLSLPTFETVLKIVKSASIVPAVFFIFLLLVIEWRYKLTEHPLAELGLKWKRPIRWTLYSFIIFAILMFMETNEAQFMYAKY